MIPETKGGTFEDIFKDDLLDEGTYHVRVNNIRKKKGAADPNDPAGEDEYFANLDLVVTGNHEKGLGRHIFQNVPLQGGQMWMLRKILEETGTQVERGTELSEANLKTIFIGLEFLIVYTHFVNQKQEKRGRISRIMKLV